MRAAVHAPCPLGSGLSQPSRRSRRSLCGDDRVESPVLRPMRTRQRQASLSGRVDDPRGLRAREKRQARVNPRVRSLIERLRHAAARDQRRQSRHRLDQGPRDRRESATSPQKTETRDRGRQGDDPAVCLGNGPSVRAGHPPEARPIAKRSYRKISPRRSPKVRPNLLQSLGASQRPNQKPSQRQRPQRKPRPNQR